MDEKPPDKLSESRFLYGYSNCVVSSYLHSDDGTYLHQEVGPWPLMAVGLQLQLPMAAEALVNQNPGTPIGITGVTQWVLLSSCPVWRHYELHG
ncbi:hypothetical protein AVEN_36418-1 [Araneus ventricosus]|uniref:Uncharacterized protein n=1 Tax=Araneus ventricosus TaxID=182803 RepID=A0A4Y2QD25_ARAVE|nr:hypothetical protein AVEN_36418-1 [Araneus ventricosus]